MTWVPVVDISDPAAAVPLVNEACERVGFLSVVGHGVDTSVVTNAWQTARQFFDLAPSQKMAVAMPFPGYPYGYSPLAGESLAASLGYHGLADLKESFAIGPCQPPQHTLHMDEEFAWSANLWPAELPEMRAAWERYFAELTDLSARLLGIMALALGLPAHYFENAINRHTSAMRALNYPAATSANNTEQFGAGAHTDYGTLTVVLADPSQGGLQVADSSGEWHDVLPEPGAFVVNLGDAMARWSNDRWRSTLHRVLVPTGRRQSIAFFHNANWDAIIQCLPNCSGPDNPPLYPPIMAGPHLMSKFKATVNEPAK